MKITCGIGGQLRGVEDTKLQAQSVSLKHKIVEEDSRSHTLENSTGRRQLSESYGKQGRLIDVSFSSAVQAPMLEIDKGTASGTTVYVGSGIFEQIVSSTTYGELKWEELGVDDEKRWVVINGQRFECEHSPEEKVARKRAQQRMTLADLMNDLEKAKQEKSKGQDNGPNLPRGNIEALKSNGPVMELLSKLTGSTSTDEIMKRMTL